MDLTFKCCRKKECPNFCCVQCFGIFHPSCMEKKRNVKILDGHKIFCSKECATKKKNEDDELKHIGEKLELLTKSMREKEMQLELAESQQDDIVKELSDEIEILKNDNIAKDDYIQKLRRASRDFEDEAASVEQNYISQFNEQKGLISEMKREIGDIIQKNTNLLTEIETMTRELNIYKKDIEELNSINKNMVTTFETMTQEKESNIEEIKKLKYEYFILKDNQISNKLLETNKNIHKLAYSHEEIENVAQKRNIKKSVLKERRLSQQPQQRIPFKNNILFVSGLHGKGMINYLSQSKEYSVQSIRKPGASDEELINTAIMNTKQFSRNDVIVLWLNKTNVSILDTFIKKTQHTQTIIISEPYRYDINVNQIIYDNNLSFCKKIHLLEIDNTSFLDCNNLIRRSNYTRDGCGLKTTIARFLSREVMRRIKDLSLRGKKHDEGESQTDLDTPRRDLEKNNMTSFLEQTTQSGNIK